MDIAQLTSMLKTKYPQSGLSEGEIKGVATTLIATGLVTDENAGTIVDAQAEAMNGFQSLFDSRFNSKRDSYKKSLEEQLDKEFKAKFHINEEGKQIIDGTNKAHTDDVSILIKKQLDEALKPITDRIAKEDDEKKHQTWMEKVVEKAKENGIPEELAKMLNVPDTVDNLDSYMKDKSQTLTNIGFQKVVAPNAGGEEKSDGKLIAEQIREGAPKKEDKK